MTRGRGGDDGGEPILLYLTRARGLRISTLFLNGFPRPVTMPDGKPPRYESMICKGQQVVAVEWAQTVEDARALHQRFQRNANTGLRVFRVRDKQRSEQVRLAICIVANCLIDTLKAKLARLVQPNEGEHDGHES
jgi:hypothetical protein